MRKRTPFPYSAPRSATLDMSPVVKFTTAGRVPPPPDHLLVASPPGSARFSLDLNLAASRIEEDAVLAFMTLALLVLAGALLWFGNYYLATGSVIWIILFFFARRYARRPHVSHRLARVLRAVFYTSFTYPGDRRPPRFRLRLSVIVFSPILLVLLILLGKS